MGGASSRFGETAWDQVNGGLKEASETIDGGKPPLGHSILTLKRPNIVNQRHFEIVNDLEEVIYTSLPVEGTTNPPEGGDATADPLLSWWTDRLPGRAEGA